MKARVKATGEIVEIAEYSTIYAENSEDYWTRLEHQYAGMAMQGLLNNNLLSSVLFKTGTTHVDYINEVVKVAEEYAHTLVEKLKEKEEK